jgi:SagB-type dehydrogenase family enzyme
VSLENLPMLRDSYLRWSGSKAVDSHEPWFRLRRVLERLGSCVVQSLGLDDNSVPALSVVPVSRQATFWLPPVINREQPIRLSRHVSIRASGGELLLESPMSQYRVAMHRPLAAWVIGSLGTTTTIANVSEQLHIAEPVLADIIGYVAATGMVMVGELEGPPRFTEDGDQTLIPWSYHDLLFHMHSRFARRNGQVGAVFPYIDRLPAAPVLRPAPIGPRFALHRPSLTDLAGQDPPLTDVIETRRSYQDYAEQALTAEQLGELLFRTARIRRTRLALASGGATYTTSDRPYPSTSDLYELELYLSIDRCAGLPRGNYHYDPRDHALTLVNDSETEVGELMDTARIAAGSTRRPAVLITVTTRIARLSWMYSRIAYSSTLKHVGALQQTLYLVSTAMGLASSALAVSDGAAADEALRLDWPTEVSVGEFVVGVRP